MRKLSPAAALFLPVLLAATACAQVVYDLPKLVDQSDVVAVVQVANVVLTDSMPSQFGSSISELHKVATLRPLRALKGATEGDFSLPYKVLYSLAGWAGGVPRGYAISDSLVPNSTRIIFLKSAIGGFEFTDGSYLSLPAAPEPLASAEGATAFDRVVRNMIGVLFSKDSTKEEKLKILWQLRSVNATEVVPALKQFLRGEMATKDEYVRTETMAAILLHGDASVLDEAEAELLSPPYGYWKQNLIYAIAHAVPADQAVPRLARVFSVPNEQMRTAAAEVLGETRSLAAISPLLQALDDPDIHVKFAVMQSLGIITREYEWRPKSTEQNPDWYTCLDHWQDYRLRWIEENQR